MKRFLINLGIFFAIVAMCDFCFGFVCDYMQAHPKGGETKLFNDLMVKDCHELLVLGSSRACHHYDPDILEQQLGLECYNAGYDGNGVILSYPILCNMINRCKPKMVIYELSSSFDIVKNDNDDNNHRYIAFLKPYYRTPVVGDVIKSISKKSYIQFHSGLCRHNSEFLTVLLDYIKPRHMNKKGFKPLQGVFTYTSPKQLTQEEDTLKTYWLEQFAQLKTHYQLDMVWVMSPQFDSIDNSYESYKIAKQIAAQYDIPVLDHYFDTIYLGREKYFKDNGHLNIYGASCFSAMLSDEIKSFLDFPSY